VTAETAALLAAGKLEQTCPRCGRWEAAHHYCSWCGRTMTEADWYRNGVVAERESRRPSVAPADPPDEYRAFSAWPAKWGPCPYVKKAPPSPTTGGNGDSDEISAPMRQMAMSL